MQLFHFTAADNIDAITVEGLKPSDTSKDGFSLHWPHDCVWFTRNLQPKMWWGDPDLFQRCVVVVLPASDKRLMSLEAWLRQHLSQDWLDEVMAKLDAINSDWQSH